MNDLKIRPADASDECSPLKGKLPASKLKPWLLSVASVHKVTKALSVVRYTFQSDAETNQEAFDAIYAYGFACVQKDYFGKIIPNGKLSVRLSNGEL